MSIGQAYSDLLTPLEQQALQDGCGVLIDHVFDELEIVKNPKDGVHISDEPSRIAHPYVL